MDSNIRKELEKDLFMKIKALEKSGGNLFTSEYFAHEAKRKFHMDEETFCDILTELTIKSYIKRMPNGSILKFGNNREEWAKELWG